MKKRQRENSQKEIPVDFRKASRASNSVQLQFLLADLDAGLTFVSIARLAKGKEAKVRNRERARAAYDCIVRFAERVTMTRRQSRDIHTKIASLRQRLEDLGENLQPLR